MEFLKKLEQGEYPLWKTYWVFGIIFYVLLFNMIIPFIDDKDIKFIIGVFMLLYEMIWLIGVWNSSNKYFGPRIWNLLAKLVVFVGIFQLMFLFVAIILHFIKG